MKSTDKLIRVLGLNILNLPVSHILSDKTYLKLKYFFVFGKHLNLQNPTTFSEKLQWLKLYNRKDIYTTMVDKYEAKKYVASLIGEEYIIPTLGVWDRFDDIDFESLPKQFVLKCTHDSGRLVICKDKSKLDIEAARKKINSCLKKNYYWQGREWPYKNVKPRIIAEQYMEDWRTNELRDYKIFTFNVIAKALFLASDRQDENTDTKFDFYDMEFKHLPFNNGHPNSSKQIAKPETFEKMRILAERLSMDISHLRVDFYEVNGKTYFGELTFAHWSGFVPYNPESWDYAFGSWIEIPEFYGGGYALVEDGFVLWLHRQEGDLSDYKIHCYNGKPQMTLVCRDRNTARGLSEDFFDNDWKHLEIRRPSIRISGDDIKEPKCFSELLEIAAKLSDGLPFLRTDFYVVNGKAFFSEFTFYPASGFEEWYPEYTDSNLGDNIKLSL